MPSRPSLWTRYLFPVALFQKPAGDAFARRAMLLANLAAARRWMPHYARVHATLAAVIALLLAAAQAGGPWWLSAAGALAEACELLILMCFGCVALATRIRVSPDRVR